MKYSRRSRDLKRYSFIAVTLLALTPLVPQAQRPDAFVRANVQPAQGGQSHLLAKYGKLPLGFEANHGQTDPQVKFVARGSGYVVFLTASEAVVVSKSATDTTQLSDSVATILRMKLAGGNPNPRISGSKELPGKSNYYIGKDPTRWRMSLPRFAQVQYEGVYPGIDLVYYGNHEGRLEHDFIVSPGADPSVVAFAFQGDETPAIASDGDLILRRATSQQARNEVRLRRPVIYQDVNGRRREISGSYEIRKDNLVGFRIGPYDRGWPLVIDPVLAIDYSTFLGGSGIDGSNSLAVDASGNTHVAGQTLSLDFPVANAFQPVYAGGDSDHFVAKLTPDGTALVYSTYLGGSLTEGVNQGAIALDAFGNAYVAGNTQSADFPTTLLAFQPALANPGQGFLSFDGYVVKLNTNGALVYSTLLGGSSFDGIYAIDVDTGGNAYVTGNTISNDFPTFLPIEPNQRNNFITKLNATGSALVYSTYFAGDIGTGIAVDILGNAIVTGLTQSTNFPVVNAVQPTMDPTECFPNVRCGDAFVSKVNPLGTGFVYSTFLGGNNVDRGNDIDVDASGAVYVIGDTRSTNFPTFNALQPTFAGLEDAFVVKLTATGSFVYSTYLGGSETEGGDFGNFHIVTLGIIIDGAGNAYLSGTTRSADFPAVDAMQPFVTGGGTEFQAFIAKLNASGSALEYSTPVNPPLEISQAVEIGIDSQGDAYIAGGAGLEFPTTAGSFQPLNAGSSDAYILKLTTTGGAPATLMLNPPAATNVIDTQHCVTATVRDTGGAPTANITVRFTVTGAVNMTGTGTTDADGEATFCYQGPSLPGADAITAFADTDNDNTPDPGEPSGAATKVWVLPTTTPLCEINITNGGRITATNGDSATFGGNAKASILGQTSGQEQYQDHGPVQPLNVHSINVQAIVCEGDMQASIYGQATINGSGSFIYRIRVQDLGEPGAGHDTYGILLSNGYSSGEQVLESGNVQIQRD